MARNNNSRGRGRGRGRGRSGRIGMIMDDYDNGSRGNPDADYDNGRGNRDDTDNDNGITSRGRGISENVSIGGSSSTSGCGNPNDTYHDNGIISRGRGGSGNIGGSNSTLGCGGNPDDNGITSRGRGRGISGNTTIGGSNSTFRCANPDAVYDNGITSRGRGRGISGNTTIGGSNSTSGCANPPDANHDNGIRSRGRGSSGHIGGSSTFGCGNQDEVYDNGIRSRGRGRSGNIGGSSSTSGCGNPDADYDNGRGGTNNNETDTSQHARGSNLPQSIPDHPSQRPMITLYYGGFAEGQITRDIISIFKIMFYEPWATWKEVDQESRDLMFGEFQDLYQWHPSDNAAVYRAWERVMAKRFADILCGCRRDAALRAEQDSITIGNDLSVLKPYTPSWIDQAHWENLIDRVWNKPGWKKKSNVARQNRLSEVDGEVSKHTGGSITIFQHMYKMEKQKKRPVTLLEAYHRCHTQESTEASGNGTDEALGSGTRKYITRRSKRVADAVEAAMEEKHGPDASQHPADDFDTWEDATGGKKKGNLVGLGTRGDPRLMVTSRTSSSSSSSYAHRTGSESSEQVRTLEETVRKLQEDNAQMRAREIEMQVQLQRQVEHQVQAHLHQRELEANAREEAANAREEAREREWQQKMNDINSVLRKFNNPGLPK